jgi:hypothetical protein
MYQFLLSFYNSAAPCEGLNRLLELFSFETDSGAAACC